MGHDDTRQVVGWAITAVGFLALNGLLWLVQDCSVHAEKAQLEVLEGELVTSAAAVDLAEKTVKEIEARLAALDPNIAACQGEVRALEAAARQGRSIGAYESARISCNSQIDRYNGMVKEQAQLGFVYGASVDHHNNMVDRANLLSEQVHSKWLLIPLPKGGGGRTRRAVH